MVCSVAQVPHESCPGAGPGGPRQGGRSVSWGPPISSRVPRPAPIAIGSVRRRPKTRQFQPNSMDSGKRGERGVCRSGVRGPGRGGAALRTCLSDEGPAIKTGIVETMATGNLCLVMTHPGVIRRGERAQANGALGWPHRGVWVIWRSRGPPWAGMACFADSPAVKRVVVDLEEGPLRKGEGQGKISAHRPRGRPKE